MQSCVILIGHTHATYMQHSSAYTRIMYIFAHTCTRTCTHLHTHVSTPIIMHAQTAYTYHTHIYIYSTHSYTYTSHTYTPTLSIHKYTHISMHVPINIHYTLYNYWNKQLAHWSNTATFLEFPPFSSVTRSHKRGRRSLGTVRAYRQSSKGQSL